MPSPQLEPLANIVRRIKVVPGMLRLLFGFWGIAVATWQVPTSVWVLGDKSRNLPVRLLLGFWGMKVTTRQVVTAFWVLGDRGRNLANSDICLGSGG
jgi:hypothetical protein